MIDFCSYLQHCSKMDEKVHGIHGDSAMLTDFVSIFMRVNLKSNDYSKEGRRHERVYSAV